MQRRKAAGIFLALGLCLSGHSVSAEEAASYASRGTDIVVGDAQARPQGLLGEVDVEFVSPERDAHSDMVYFMATSLGRARDMEGLYVWSTLGRARHAADGEFQVVYSDASRRRDAIRVVNAVGQFVGDRVCLSYEPEGWLHGFGEINVILPRHVEEMGLLGGPGHGSGSIVPACVEPRRAVEAQG